MSSRPLSILIMNRKYDATIGGVERISVSLANEMASRGHKVHIVSLDCADARMHFNLDTKVVWHKISRVSADQKAGIFERLRRLFLIRRLMKENKIDVAIGFQDGAYLSLMVSAIFTGVPVIAAERNAPSRFDYLKNKNMKKFVFNSFRFAQAITVQCPSYVEEYPLYLRSKTSVIPNPVLPAHSHARPDVAINGRKKILFVGRLDYQKNVSTLIDAFSLVSKGFPMWNLEIVGDGHDLEALVTKVNSLKLQEKILFAGAQKDVSTYYTSAHVFCLPSLWEGFPNALAEAMAHGLPACGFAKCSGVRDLIEDGVTGLLAEGDSKDAQSLASSLKILLSDPELCARMGAAGFEKSKIYVPESVYTQWEDLFQALAARR